MNVFKCTEKCFHRARLFELDETLKSDAGEVQHFVLVQGDGPGKPDKPPGKPIRTAAKKSSKAKTDKNTTSDILG